MESPEPEPDDATVRVSRVLAELREARQQGERLGRHPAALERRLDAPGSRRRAGE